MVTSIVPEKHIVQTDQNRAFHYDKCIIATGSRADLPPYVSLEKAEKTRGVFVYRNISDLDAIISYADKPEIQRAVVVGGGLLGLEAAKAVYDMPTCVFDSQHGFGELTFLFIRISHVSIINRSSFPLSRQLDAEAGEMVLHKIQGMGVQVLTRCSPRRQVTRPLEHGSDVEVFVGLELEDGSIHEADLVIYAIGIRPRDDLARDSGIRCSPKGGIVVGDDLKTSGEDVYAIGECASWKNNTYGLIGPGSKFLNFESLIALTILTLSRNGGYPVFQSHADGHSRSPYTERP